MGREVCNYHSGTLVGVRLEMRAFLNQLNVMQLPCTGISIQNPLGLCIITPSFIAKNHIFDSYRLYLQTTSHSYRLQFKKLPCHLNYGIHWGNQFYESWLPEFKWTRIKKVLKFEKIFADVEIQVVPITFFNQ